VTRGGRNAIWAAVDTLLFEHSMETGLMLEYLRQTRAAHHTETEQAYDCNRASVERPREH